MKMNSSIKIACTNQNGKKQLNILFLKCHSTKLCKVIKIKLKTNLRTLPIKEALKSSNIIQDRR